MHSAKNFMEDDLEKLQRKVPTLSQTVKMLEERLVSMEEKLEKTSDRNTEAVTDVEITMMAHSVNAAQSVKMLEERLASMEETLEKTSDRNTEDVTDVETSMIAYTTNTTATEVFQENRVDTSSEIATTYDANMGRLARLNSRRYLKGPCDLCYRPAYCTECSNCAWMCCARCQYWCSQKFGGCGYKVCRYCNGPDQSRISEIRRNVWRCSECVNHEA